MRALIGLLLLVGLFIGGFAAFAWHKALPAISRPAPGTLSTAVVRKGGDLAALGNCATCHTSAGGERFAGGRPIDTPFGKVYSTNITPDPETGIGSWSEAAFARAVRQGISRDGHQLYPAFPYDHMTRMTDEDIAAVYAFMMSRRAVRVPTKDNELRFPFNVRALVAVWKLLFFNAGPLRPDQTRSLEWNRGAYLVEGLAHCGSCHTPRNGFGAEDASNAYAGGSIDGWIAPALNASSPSALPWTAERLSDYLRTGASNQHGAAAGPMAEVVGNLATVPEADVRAMAAYVASVAGAPSKDRLETGEKALARAEGKAAVRSSGPTAGAAIYAGACAQCHGEAGREPLSPALNLALSSAVRETEPNNLVRIVLHGLEPAQGSAGAIMPGFGAVLDDKQMSDLIDYVRASFTDAPAFAGIEAAVRTARQ